MVALAATLAGGAAQACDGAPGPSRAIQAAKIILVGDSATAVRSGWGSSFCANHATAALACLNLARGGRGALGYRAEGSWDLALREMAVQGYATPVHVLIQFGHDDPPVRAGRPSGPESGFPDTLRRYVAEARAAGAVPVLVTPLVRRTFADGRLRNDLESWAEAVRAVAAETGTPLIDLNALSAELVQALGPDLAARLSQAPPPEGSQALLSGATPPSPPESEPAQRPHDNGQLGGIGADVFAAQVARALIDAAPALRRHVVL